MSRNIKKLQNLTHIVQCRLLFHEVFPPVDVAPAIGSLFVSNITSQSFTVSWNDMKGNIESFILEIIDSSWRREPVEYNLNHGTRSYEITDLRPATDYIAYLTGIVKGRRTNSVSVVASTGNWNSLFSSCFIS